MDFEKQAIETLRMLAGDSKFTIADSGGKDSSVLTHIAMKSGCAFKCQHCHTTVDAPETVYFIRRKFEKLRKQGVECEIVYPEKSMWELIVQKGTPPTRKIRYCCSKLKENHGKGEKLVTGVRKAESTNRKNNQGIVTFTRPHKNVREMVDDVNFQLTNRGGVVVLNLDNDENRRVVEDCYRTQKILINPLIDWDDEYLLWYIKHENIELNPLYSQGWNRVGCIGCPMAGKHRYWEFERYPKYKEAYIRAFDKMLVSRAEKGLKNMKGWKDGKSVFKWWMDEEWDPDQIEIKDWLLDIGVIDFDQYNDDNFVF